MSLKDQLMEEFFYDHECDLDENPAERHAMTLEHEEVLWQFLDRTGVDPEKLKEILINGYIFRLMKRR